MGFAAFGLIASGGLYGSVHGYTIARRDDVDVHLADGDPEDPDRGAVHDRALGGPPDPRGRAGQRRRNRPDPTAAAPPPSALTTAARAQTRTPWRPCVALTATRAHHRHAPASALPLSGSAQSGGNGPRRAERARPRQVPNACARSLIIVVERSPNRRQESDMSIERSTIEAGTGTAAGETPATAPRRMRARSR